LNQDRPTKCRNYYLGWIDGDCIKAGELAALVALELALIDRYGGPGQAKRSRNGGPPMLGSLVTYMIEKYGVGVTVRNLYETAEATASRR
jgi:hypothetical protein